MLEPESTAQAGDHILNWNVQSWSKKVPQDVIPSVFKLKWLEPRHLVNIENRWSRDRTNDLQHMFFNGIGYNAWENVWGIWNQLTPRDAEALRRIATIQRQFAPLMVSPDWTPYEKTLQAGVFASRFPGAGVTLWTMVNRNEYEVEWRADRSRARAGHAAISMSGTACVLEPRHRWHAGALHAASSKRRASARFSPSQATRSRRTSRRSSSKCASSRARRCARSQPNGEHCRSRSSRSSHTRAATEAPAGMIAIPAGEFDFAVHGIEIEGQTSDGLDVQYPWESSPRRAHRGRVRMLLSTSTAIRSRTHSTRRSSTRAAIVRATLTTSCAIGRTARRRAAGRTSRSRGCRSKTRARTRSGRASGCRTSGNGSTPHRAVTVVASRGATSGRARSVPATSVAREMPPPDDVDAHPAGASPFGVMDLVGNVWQWTDEYVDAHTRAAILRGGTAYQPQTSHWYFPQAYRLDQHGKYLLMAPCKDRSAGIGFRCVVDAA